MRSGDQIPLSAPARLPRYRHTLRSGTNSTAKIFTVLALAAGAALYGVLIALFAGNFLLELTLPLIILALLVIWALPNTARGPVRLLEWLFFGFFALLLLWPDYLAIALPGLPWITVRRLFAAPMALVLLICLSVNSQTRLQIKEALRSEPVLAKLLVTFLVIQAFSVFLSRNIGFSIDRLIVAQLYWTVPFFAGLYIFSKPGRIARWAAIFCLISAPLAVAALFEWSRSQVPWAGRIPSFLKVEDEAVQRILSGAARAATGEYRVQSTFTTSLGYAEYLALTTPFLIHYLVTAPRLVARIGALVALPITFFLIIITDSRLGVAGFFLSFLGYLAAWGAIRWRRYDRSLFGPAITLAYPVLFALFLTATFWIGRLRAMIWGSGQHQASTDARAEQYARGWDILAGNPLGHGVGMGAETLGWTNLAGVLTIDTYYLLIALEYGIVGFFVYYGMLLVSMWRSASSLLTAPVPDREFFFLVPLTVAVAVFVVIKSVFSQEANHPLIFMMLAAMIALIYRSRNAAQVSEVTRY